mmetsp:Transcript_21063/g.50776  ORF Transcript_21063/g.50776 Transcript_21063/m.50776 type:complete len:274 (+) Transcript_21063:555-1376(+)
MLLSLHVDEDPHARGAQEQTDPPDRQPDDKGHPIGREECFALSHGVVHLVGSRRREAPSGGPAVHLKILRSHRGESRLDLRGVERGLEVGGGGVVAPSVVGEEAELDLDRAHIAPVETNHIVRLDAETLDLEDLGDQTLRRDQEQCTFGGALSQLFHVRSQDLRRLDGRLGVGVRLRHREDAALEAGGAAILDQADLDEVVHCPQVVGDVVGVHVLVLDLVCDSRRSHVALLDNVDGDLGAGRRVQRHPRKQPGGALAENVACGRGWGKDDVH